MDEIRPSSPPLSPLNPPNQIRRHCFPSSLIILADVPIKNDGDEFLKQWCRRLVWINTPPWDQFFKVAEFSGYKLKTLGSK